MYRTRFTLASRIGTGRAQLWVALSLAGLAGCASEPGEVSSLQAGAESCAISACGNGLSEPGEVCDEGNDNGLPGHCDTACQFRCEGPCPLRVNPDAAPGGSGASWQDPMSDLQAALEQQAVAGGGDVWVLGGTFARLTSAGEDLVSMPSGVALRGGFSGSERTADERIAATPPTHLLGPIGLTDISQWTGRLLSVVGQDDVLIERVQVEHGEAALFVTGSRGVVVRDSTIGGAWRHQFQPAWEDGGGAVLISDSSIRFEHSELVMNYGEAIRVERTDIGLTDSNMRLHLDGGGGATRITDSRLSMQRSRFYSTQLGLTEDPCILRIGGSQVLMIDSDVSGFQYRGQSFNVSDSSVLFVNSIVRDADRCNVGAAGSSSLFMWNSNILSAAAGHTEIALSTLPDCGDEWGGGTGTLLVHNSIVPRSTPLYSQGGTTLVGNCVIPGTIYSSPGDPPRYLVSAHPCPNGGDAAELEASRQRMLAQAAPFRAEPFRADLSAYETANWWRSQSLVTGQCTDEGAPDPGQHYPLTCD